MGFLKECLLCLNQTDIYEYIIDSGFFDDIYKMYSYYRSKIALIPLIKIILENIRQEDIPYLIETELTTYYLPNFLLDYLSDSYDAKVVKNVFEIYLILVKSCIYDDPEDKKNLSQFSGIKRLNYLEMILYMKSEHFDGILRESLEGIANLADTEYIECPKNDEVKDLYSDADLDALAKGMFDKMKTFIQEYKSYLKLVKKHSPDDK
jgi:hypothetical protein